MARLFFMAGLYFHIPFCKRICAYCDFFREADLSRKDRAVEAMHLEMEEQRHFLSDATLRTIYFGGGTPSLLAAEQVQGLIDHAARLWDCSAVEELTLEANPDDLTADYVASLRGTSINRVSLGVQSFDDEELRFMNRRHTAAEAVAAVQRLQDAGIENITIDLIFGVDGFGEQVLERSLDQALQLGVKHVSAYHLTIEPHTTFHRRLLRGQMQEVSEERSLAEYLLVHRRLTEAGYEHYEVSNYALDGYRARHNSSYWQGAEYLGIGAGAHSFNGVERHWASQSVAEYIEQRHYEREQLTERDRFNEYVMTSLRCKEGIRLDYVEERFGRARRQDVERGAEQWVASGDVVCRDGRVFVPEERFMISDAVIESIFDV